MHPTFLYESLWNLALLILLFLYRKHKKFSGEVMLLYIAGYGIGRFWIESIRTDQLYITGTTVPVSMVLAALMTIAGVGLDIYFRIRIKRAAKKAEDPSE